MADLYLLPSEQTSVQSRDELRSAATSASSATKTRIVNAMDALANKDSTPEKTLESSRELAGAVFQQLREQKFKPNEFKAVLNDVPAHARGAVEDALKSYQIAPTYLAPKENGRDFDVVNAQTDKATKRPNPAQFDGATTPVDLRSIPAAPAENGAKESAAVGALLQETANTRVVADIRTNVEQIASAAKAHFDQAGVPEGSRAVVVNAPPHLTGALESALERKGIAAFHGNENTNEVTRGATTHSGAEQRGLQTVREGFGPEGKGVSDSQIRQAVGSERLQALGQNPKALSAEAIQQVLDNKPETITEINRKVNAVLEVAQTFELKSDVGPNAATAGVEKALPVVRDSASSIKVLEPETTSTNKRPADIVTRAPEKEGQAPAPTKSQVGADMLRSYMVEATPEAMKAKSGIKLDGMSTFVGMQNMKIDIPTEKDIAKHIDKATLESFARDGVPHRELESLNSFLSSRAAQAGAQSAPDRLDSVHIRQVAMNLKSDPTTQIRHEGKVIGTVAEIRQELSKVNTLESQAKEQLRGVLPEKGFDTAFKQLDLRAVQDIAKNGVDRALVEQVKTQMNQKAPNNPGWFKTTDAINAISTAKSELSGKQLVSTSMVFEGKNDKYDGAAVMLKVSDLRSQVQQAEKALGREQSTGAVPVAARIEPTLGPDPSGLTKSANERLSSEAAKPAAAESKATTLDSEKTQEKSTTTLDKPNEAATATQGPTKDTTERSNESQRESQDSKLSEKEQDRQQPQREASFERTR